MLALEPLLLPALELSKRMVATLLSTTMPWVSGYYVSWSQSCEICQLMITSVDSLQHVLPYCKRPDVSIHHLIYLLADVE